MLLQKEAAKVHKDFSDTNNRYLGARKMKVIQHNYRRQITNAVSGVNGKT